MPTVRIIGKLFEVGDDLTMSRIENNQVPLDGVILIASVAGARFPPYASLVLLFRRKSARFQGSWLHPCALHRNGKLDSDLDHIPITILPPLFNPRGMVVWIRFPEHTM